MFARLTKTAMLGSLAKKQLGNSNFFYKMLSNLQNGLLVEFLTIIRLARMGSASIAHEAEGQMECHMTHFSIYVAVES